MSDFLSDINGYIWSNALVFLCLAAGVFFSIRTRLVQVRQIPEMIRLMFRGEKSPSGVSSFQALTISLAGRVGTGKGLKMLDDSKVGKVLEQRERERRDQDELSRRIQEQRREGLDDLFYNEDS